MSKLPETTKENPKWNGVCDFSNYEIFIGTNDPDTKPHFHVLDSKSHGNDFHCKISIVDANYTTDEQSRLRSEDVDLMIQTLKSIIPKETGISEECSLWRMLILTWNSFNNVHVDEFYEQPDYNRLKESNL